jgi:AcrR family transcriptional regulator
MEPAPLPTRERQRQETRSLILKVALAEIAEAGLGGARIEQIARKAGVTRPTIYAHFPRREDFLLALQQQTEEVTLHALRERLGDADSAAELVHRLVDAIFELLEAGHPVLRRESFALIVREPEDLDWVGRALFGFLAERLSAAQARGELPRSPPAPDLTRILMTAIFGFLVVENEPVASRRSDAHQLLDLLVGERRGGRRKA